MIERLTHAADSAITWAVAAFLGGIGWMVRRVLTNERKIAMLEADLARREQQRAEDREALSAVRASVDQIKTILMTGAAK